MNLTARVTMTCCRSTFCAVAGFTITFTSSGTPLTINNYFNSYSVSLHSKDDISAHNMIVDNTRHLICMICNVICNEQKNKTFLPA